MQTITIETSTGTHEIEAYDPFQIGEGYMAYAKRIIVPFIESNCPTITTLRCQLSGFPVSAILYDELCDMVAHAAASLRLNRQETFPLETQRDAIESIIDSLEVRVLMHSKPSPAMSFHNGTHAIAALRPERQLSILLSHILWNAGLFHEKPVRYEDRVEAMRRTVEVADFIRAEWDTNETLKEIHGLLVELDAKYRIANLQFSKEEMNALNAIRQNVLDWQAIWDFVFGLIQTRDKNLDISDDKITWTNEVYRESSIRAANYQQKPERSNVIESEAKVKKAKPLTEKQKKNLETQALFRTIFADMGFGSKG